MDRVCANFFWVRKQKFQKYERKEGEAVLDRCKTDKKQKRGYKN